MSGGSHRIDSGDIEIYRDDDKPSRAYELISIVNGESCQRQFKGAEASANDAVKTLREDAARFKAHAVISTQCFSFKPEADSICYSEVSCVGRAVQWRD
ncbi:Rcs stress response system protein RcsF [Idiomarina sp. PL1-037]|uniref:Rcs stress response system protein RcsF n=1 Tax=Idiomarina TaxID=135575 RepID=UPI00294B0601|nr:MULTISPECIES: Rcs stress response system protein RcsF [unclassified Idiomarina]MDV6326620.1 Rcs stress response system protein RcsF [Idiomarina sp. Sol25]WQC54005.1 Rcs stress response system protein RcsF [Idiomarina sp. PL1-037]